MKLPNFIIVGALKSGTTSLFYYLGQHPEIFVPSDIKEARFFAFDPDDPEHRSKKDVFTIRTVEEYAALFAGAGVCKAVGEASPMYLTSRLAAENIKRYVPEAKIIVCLRNPVDVVYSSFYMRVNAGTEDRGFLEMFREEAKNGLLDRRLYYPSLLNYFEQFPPDRIKVILYDDFREDNLAEVRKVFEFLGVNPEFLPGHVYLNRGGVRQNRKFYLLYKFFARRRRFRLFLRGALPAFIRKPLSSVRRRVFDSKLEGYPAMPAEVRQEVEAFFRKDVLRTQELVGKDLTGWLSSV